MQCAWCSVTSAEGLAHMRKLFLFIPEHTILPAMPNRFFTITLNRTKSNKKKSGIVPGKVELYTFTSYKKFKYLFTVMDLKKNVILLLQTCTILSMI